MAGSVLGTHVIVFEGDGSHLHAALKNAEGTAQKSSERINAVVASNVKAGMDAATKAAAAAASAIGTNINAGMGVAARASAAAGAAIAANVKSGLNAATNASAVAGATIAANIKGGVDQTAKAAAAAAPRLLAPYRDLTPVLRSANQQAADLAKKISHGAIIGQRDVAKLTASQMRLREQIVATFGSLEKATAGAAAGYNRVTSAAQRATAEARRQQVAFKQAREATAESGMNVGSLQDVIVDAARGRGNAGAVAIGFAQNIFLAVAAQKQLTAAMDFYKSRVLGSGVLEYWGKVANKITDGAKKKNDKGMQDFWDTLFAAGTGDFEGAALAAVGQQGGIDVSGGATRSKSLQEQRRVRDRMLESRLEEAQLKKNAASVRELTLAIIERSRADLQQEGLSGRAIDQLTQQQVANTKLRLDIEATERTKQEAAASRERELAVLSRELEVAQQTRNADALGEVTAKMQRLNAESLRAQGFTDTQINQLQSLEERLRDVAAAEVAAANAQAVYAASTSLGRQLLSFDPDKLGAARALAEQDHAEEVMKFEEMMKRKVATAEEGDALIAQSRAVLAERLKQIDAEAHTARIDKDVSLTAGLLDVAKLQNAASATGAYAAEIERLTDETEKLAVARLRAEGRDEEADILQEKQKAQRALQTHEMRVAMNQAAAELSAQLVQMTFSREEAMRAIEEGAHRDRTAELRERFGNSAATDALIAQSHEIMIARLRDVDAEYGADWGRLLEQIAMKYEEEFRNVAATTERTVGYANALISDGLFAGIMGDLDAVEDAFKNFGKSVLREFTNILAAQATAQLLKLLKQLALSSGYTGTGMSVATASSWMDMAFANGGIAPGGFKAFASGGIVTRPTLGLVGEGRHNEAIVPLPDGKSIPVIMEQPPAPDQSTFVAEHIDAMAQEAASRAMRSVASSLMQAGDRAAATGWRQIAEAEARTTAAGDAGQTFAGGSIANRPTIGLVEEDNRGGSSALRDGRSIPVEARAGRTPQPVNVEVVWTPEFISGIVKSAAAQGADQAGKMVVPIVAGDILRNGSLRKIIQTAV